MTVANEKSAAWTADIPPGGSGNPSMEFVSLAGGGRRPPGGGASALPPSLEHTGQVPMSPQTQRTLLADWGQSLLGVDESGLKSKFDVTWEVVKAELIYAMTSMRPTIFGGASQQRFDEGGVLSEVSGAFQGDWWGPVWLSLTLSALLSISRTAPMILFRDSTAVIGITGLSMWLAFLLPPLYLAYLSFVLRFFTKTVVRDPTFFGTEKQREKCLSMVGYSLTPLVSFVLFDIACGTLGMHRANSIHWISVALTGLPSGHYLHKRFPLRAIGGYADGWDRRSSRTFFWTSYCVGFLIFVTTIQMWFV